MVIRSHPSSVLAPFEGVLFCNVRFRLRYRAGLVCRLCLVSFIKLAYVCVVVVYVVFAILYADFDLIFYYHNK